MPGEPQHLVGDYLRSREEARMPNTITIRKAFSSGDDAAAARDRLASAGFAREDIAVDQVDQHFELSIHTAPEQAQRFRDDTKKQQGLGGWRSVLPD